MTVVTGGSPWACARTPGAAGEPGACRGSSEQEELWERLERQPAPWDREAEGAMDSSESDNEQSPEN